MTAATQFMEATSPDGVVRVRVAPNGRTLWIGLSADAIRLPAAELARDIMCVNVLAIMMFQALKNRRAKREVAIYARFIAKCCSSRPRRQEGPAVTPAGAETRHVCGHTDDDVADRVLARLERIDALLADVPVDVRGEGGVVVSVDPAGRLAGLSLAPHCTTRYSVAELEKLLNNALTAAGESTGKCQFSLSA
jgi:hypothetical protein